MNKTKIFYALLLVCAATVFSCDPNEDSNNQNNNGNFAENFGAEVSRDFIGQVVDMNNVPVQNATIKIGTETAQTNSHGVFIINDANVHERFAYVTATKSGYLEGSRSLVPTAGKNNVRIMMIPSTPVATVASGASSTVDLPSGAQVVFDGAFQDESGNAYSGDVSVAMFHLTPSNPNIASLMPGMLYAEDAIGSEVVLQTLGMLNVEMRGAGGQKLQIASGHTAEISMTIDPTQLGTAPSTIPLWHFDEAAGYWKQDGTAVRSGNKYTGTVSHFSWWNCDTFQSTVSLTVTVNDSNGNPISNAGVGLIAGNFSSYIQYTGTNGNVSGLVPANQTMTLHIVDNCGNVIHTETVGPFTSDTELPTIVIDGSQIQTTTVEGTLQQCDNSDVTNGYVSMWFGNQMLFSPVTAGHFSFSTLVCSTSQTFMLQGFDYNNLQQTDSIAYTFSTPVTNIGTIAACNTVNEFISYSIDGGPATYILSNITANSGSTGAGITIYTGTSPNGNLYIIGNTDVPGTYSTTNFQIEGSAVGYISQQSPNTVVFNLTNSGGVGEYIDITFNGTYQNNTETHTISGVAHVIRDN